MTDETETPTSPTFGILILLAGIAFGGCVAIGSAFGTGGVLLGLFAGGVAFFGILVGGYRLFFMDDQKKN